MTLMLLDGPVGRPKKTWCRMLHHAGRRSGITVPAAVTATRIHGAATLRTATERGHLVSAVNRILAAMDRETAQSSIRR
jgi:hypothetical protein